MRPGFLCVLCLPASDLKSQGPRVAQFPDAWLKNTIIRENDAARDVVLEFSNVAGPMVAYQGTHGFGGIELIDLFIDAAKCWTNIPPAREYLISVPAKAADKWGKHSTGSTNLHEIREPEPIVSGLDSSRRRCERRFAWSACCRPARTLFLQHAEQLGLKLQWHITHFIEEKGAAVGQGEAAHMRVDRAGKGSASWPKSSLSSRPAGIAAQFTLTKL